MLNRRTIRIKAMQSLFAFEQCKRSNYHLALDLIEQTFQPDLNSMEVQNKPLLKAQNQEAKQLFKDNFRDKKAKISAGSADIINKTVSEAIKKYHRQLISDRQHLKKSMLRDAESIYKRYAWLMWLPVALVRLSRLEKEKKGQDPSTNFIENSFIKQIAKNNELEKVYLKSGFSWEQEADELKLWLKEIIFRDTQYQEYLQVAETDFETDKDIVLYLMKSVVFKHENIEQYMENSDLYWSENKTILKSMVMKTLKTITREEENFELAEMSYNWEDDKEFFELIYEKTLEDEDKYEALIAQKTKNWDIDRISETDKILLEMAIQEMINFPAIPIKVTINEYIEISKRYSTPKSKQFVNGVLDVIAVDLQEQGIIKKSGRGLIDNK
jgi:N utilization substance protein B